MKDLTDNQQNVLNLIENGTDSVVDIAYQMNKTHSEVVYILKRLRQKELVARIENSSQPGHYNKYVIIE